MTRTTEGIYEHRFDRPGTYRYKCDLHFMMNGRVDVVEPGRTARGE